VIATITGLAMAQTGSAATSCVYNGTTHQLTVTHVTGIQDVTIRTIPNAADPSTAPGIAVLEGSTPLSCGDPIASQVDTVAFVHLDGISQLIIEEPRLFAPGYTSEGGGTTSEIEFTVKETSGILFAVVLRDGDGLADTYVVGAGGVNVNTDDPIDDPDVVLAGTFFTDFSLEGGAGNDRFSALGGEGTGAAATGKVEMAGGAGNDTLTGGTGGDSFDGGPGDDLVDGRGGDDDISYGDSTRGVAIDLSAAGPQDGGSLGRDTLSSIESASGSDFADVLRGTADANLFFAGDGNDLIEGRGGNDPLYAGDGIDTVSYESAPAPVAVDLAIAVPQDTRGAGVDDFRQPFDNVIGGPGADVLRGTADANVMTGGPGGDTLLALAGSDTLLVRDGIPDTADCGAGTDSVDTDLGGIDALIGCENVSTGAPTAPPTPPISGPPVAPGGVTTPPRPTTAGRRGATLTGAAVQKLVRGGVVVTLGCPELACSARATAGVKVRVGAKLRRRALIPVRARLAPGRSRAIRVRLKAPDLRRVRTALHAGRRPVVRVSVAVVDDAGAVVTLRRTIRIRA
jgi:RTX calcium-binding nonapeptide repeat (4 copies)